MYAAPAPLPLALDRANASDRTLVAHVADGDPGELPFTGFDARIAALLGMLALLMGAGLTRIASKREG